MQLKLHVGSQPALVVITTPTIVQPKEPKWLNSMFDNGLEVAHVRKPGASKEELRAYLKQIEPQFRRRLRLHQHHDLVAELDCGVGFCTASRAAFCALKLLLC